MNFTREPIIETIITPKEGYKLIVRNSKGGTSEEYSVEAIEVVSFGRSFFYRSLERPKSFLLPVSDYEVIESKETRVVLKNVPLERSIKIGGGKAKSSKDAQSDAKSDEKPKRRKTLRRRKPTEEKAEAGSEEVKTDDEKSSKEEEKKPEEKPPKSKTQGKPTQKSESKKTDEPQASSSMFKSLFPPPSSLIKKEEIVIPEAPAQKQEFLSEDNMDKPDVELPENLEPVKEEEQEKKTEDKHDENVPDESRSPRYHEAPQEGETTGVKENPPKDEDSTLQFKAENNFAF